MAPERNGAGRFYPEQRVRLGEFEAAHPAVTVLEPRRPYERWQAVIGEGTVPGDGREMIVTDDDLGPFVERLEELFDPPDLA